MKIPRLMITAAASGSGKLEQTVDIDCLFHGLRQKIQLHLQILDLFRQYQSQMTAFQKTVFQFRQITIHFDRQLFFDHLLHPGIQHSRDPVQDHAFDMAVLFVFQKSLNKRNNRHTHTPAVYKKNCRRVGGIRQIPGTGADRDTRQAIIVTHDPLDHRHIRVGCVFFEEKTGGVFIGKKSIQIAAFCTDHFRVEHGINIIRSAFEGDYFQTSVF